MAAVPNDPVILLSYLNTQLRDHYSSLAELCNVLGIDQGETEAKLQSISYYYDSDLNQFV